ncbi:MAG TPA: DUF2891 domain-containing protein [Bryobacteraceae bacterium]
MTLDLATAERFANLALACIHREYPTKLGQHVLNSDDDVRPARELTPAFYGCYDWHSAVHGHWMLIRLARTFPGEPLAARVKHSVGRNLTPENLKREEEYLKGKGRESFERPYGLAWLLQLAAELRAWNDADAQRWSGALTPLAELVEQRIQQWLGKLSHPVRSGEHSQSAFSFGLMLDYARASDRPEFAQLLEAKTREFYSDDRNAPLAYEPSGEDFLSPCLAEADVMRRVMRGAEFADWLGQFLPQIPLRPAQAPDASDPKLGHLDGLNLSRAWMLRGILHALPPGDARIVSLQVAADEHAAAGLASVSGTHYEGAHWLGTFAVYLLTESASAQS